MCRYYGLNEVAEYWHQVVKINNHQRDRFSRKIIKHFDEKLKGKKIAILGWAFKERTNDSRESSSIYICKKLLKNGAKLFVHDPNLSFEKVIEDLDQHTFPNDEFVKDVKPLDFKKISEYKLEGIVLMNNEHLYLNFDWKKLDLDNILVFDGRNGLKDHEIPNHICL